jgi:hypothetical protein
MTKCTEALEALTRIRDKAHEYGALPAEIERLADDELRAFLADTPACDAEKAVLVRALDLMLQAFDYTHPDACTPECFETSDGHGPEVQEIAKKKARAALAPGEAE